MIFPRKIVIADGSSLTIDYARLVAIAYATTIADAINEANSKGIQYLYDYRHASATLERSLSQIDKIVDP